MKVDLNADELKKIKSALDMQKSILRKSAKTAYLWTSDDVREKIAKAESSQRRRELLSEAWKVQILDEYNEAKERFEKIKEFLESSPLREELDPEELDLLKTQKESMVKYIAALEKRVSFYNIDKDL